MSLQPLILDRGLRSFLRAPAVRPAPPTSRPGRWALANLVLALACVLAGVTMLSARLVGAEPCFQSPSGNCGQARQVGGQPSDQRSVPRQDAAPAPIPGPLSDSLQRSDVLLAL